MRRACGRGPLSALVLLLSCLLAPASPARAAGLDLAWDDCAAGAGVAARTSTCRSDVGAQALVGSFQLAADQPRFVGIEATLEIRVEAETLPEWWSFFHASACRASALSASFDFARLPGCEDPWSGQALGGIAAYHTAASSPARSGGRPNVARIVLGAALAHPVALRGGIAYHAFQLVISNARTTAGCAGCASPACVTLLELRAVQQDGAAERLVSPLHSERAAWQGAGSCASSVQHRSWGQVKNLYR